MNRPSPPDTQRRSQPAAVNLRFLLKKQDAKHRRAVYQQAIDSGHPDQAPTAAFNLGLLLEEQGDLEGAQAAYQLAINSGHLEASPAEQ